MADEGQSRAGQAYQAAKTIKQVQKVAEAGRAAALLANPATWVALAIGAGVFILALIVGMVLASVSAANPGGGQAQQAPAAGGAANCGHLSGTPKDIIDTVALPIAHQIAFKDITPESVEAANAAHSDLTTSGNVSDHKGPPERAWAADISNGRTTPEEDQLAEDLASCFGIKWSGSGLVNGDKDGYRIQLIYRTYEGGDHYDHVHIGVSKG